MNTRTSKVILATISALALVAVAIVEGGRSTAVNRAAELTAIVIKSYASSSTSDELGRELTALAVEHGGAEGVQVTAAYCSPFGVHCTVEADVTRNARRYQERSEFYKSQLVKVHQVSEARD